MRTSLLLVLISWLSLSRLLAQQQGDWFVKEEQSEHIQLDVSIRDGALTVEAPGFEPGGFIKIQSIHLDDADLLISYSLDIPLVRHSYQLRFVLEDANGRVLGDGQLDEAAKINAFDRGQGTIRWYDATEKGLYPGERYRLLLQKQLLWTFDCDQGRPAFTLRQNWPYYSGGLAGLGLLGVAEIFRQQKENALGQYRDRYLAGESRQADDPDLILAEQAYRTQRTLTYVGAGLVVAGTVGYFLHRHFVRQKQQWYDDYCTDTSSGLGWSLDLENAPGGAYPAFSLTYRF